MSLAVKLKLFLVFLFFFVCVCVCVCVRWGGVAWRGGGGEGRRSAVGISAKHRPIQILSVSAFVTPAHTLTHTHTHTHTHTFVTSKEIHKESGAFHELWLND